MNYSRSVLYGQTHSSEMAYYLIMVLILPSSADMTFCRQILETDICKKRWGAVSYSW